MQLPPITTYSILYSIFNVLGASILKTRLSTSSVGTLREFVVFLLHPKSMLAIAFVVASMYFSIRALSVSKFSSAIPYMTGFNFALTVAVGFVLFKERLNLVGYVGIITIFTGIALMSMGYATSKS